jgi:hypothetical protein
MRAWIVGLLAVVILVAAYWVYRRKPAPAPVTPPATTVERTAPVRPLGGTPEPIVLPPLDQSDALVRDLVRKFSSHPAIVSWLTTTGLIRNFTVVVANVAEGTTPARQLRVWRPATAFRVETRGSQIFIDPASYARYERLAAAVSSIDPAGAARLYATLKPRIEEAYGELGMPPASFDRALERAIVTLLEVPSVAGPVRVEPKGGVAYQFADPRLEGLTAAQKQLLRTGPENVRAIQTALRQLGLALGMSPERLR